MKAPPPPPPPPPKKKKKKKFSLVINLTNLLGADQSLQVSFVQPCVFGCALKKVR